MLENSAKLRLFVALTLPEPVKDALAQAQAEMRRAWQGEGIRWTRREQFHLTLRFLGAVDAHRLDGLINALHSAAGNYPSFRLRAEGTGCFPGWRSPRVIWIGARAAGEALLKLQKLVEVATADFTREKAEEEFKGHLTLARIKTARRPQIDSLGQIVRALNERSFGEWPVNRVELIRSDLSPSGSCYTTAVEIPLAPGSLQVIHFGHFSQGITFL